MMTEVEEWPGKKGRKKRGENEPNALLQEWTDNVKKRWYESELLHYKKKWVEFVQWPGIYLNGHLISQII